jgi:hypothetical protein
MQARRWTSRFGRNEPLVAFLVIQLFELSGFLELWATGFQALAFKKLTRDGNLLDRVCRLNGNGGRYFFGALYIHANNSILFFDDFLSILYHDDNSGKV